MTDCQGRELGCNMVDCFRVKPKLIGERENLWEWEKEDWVLTRLAFITVGTSWQILQNSLFEDNYSINT